MHSQAELGNETDFEKNEESKFTSGDQFRAYEKLMNAKGYISSKTNFTKPNFKDASAVCEEQSKKNIGSIGGECSCYNTAGIPFGAANQTTCRYFVPTSNRVEKDKRNKFNVIGEKNSTAKFSDFKTGFGSWTKEECETEKNTDKNSIGECVLDKPLTGGFEFGYFYK